MKESVVDKFNDIKNGIAEKINAARDTVRDAIAKIKSFFDFEWSLPKLKMPHFNIKGEFSLNPPSIPTISVDWFAKAMNDPLVMTGPTIFGYNADTGSLMGGGEVGTEVVSGANTLMSMIQNAVAEQNNALAPILYQILEAILAMDEHMGGNLREALSGTSFEVNNREFARLVKAVR